MGTALRNRHRAAVVGCALAALAYLAGRAALDPEVPFLGPRLTWWAAPQPAEGMGLRGPFAFEFRFVPRQAGELRIAAMSELRLLGPDGVLLEAKADDWKQGHVLEVDGSPLTAYVSDARYHPVLGVGGPAAPAIVQLIAVTYDPTAAIPPSSSAGGVSMRLGASVDAVLASSYRDVPPALSGVTLWLAYACALVLLAGFGFLASRPVVRAAAPRETTAYPIQLGVILLFIVIAGWNVSRYPVSRGLDAAGHLAAVEAISHGGAIPDPGATWQSYHPPLYHAIAASVVALFGTPRALQLLSTLAALALLVLAARALGPERWRGLALLAFAPVLLVTAPQATNEVFFALLATALLVSAARPLSRVNAAATGALAGAALLTKYTAAVFLAATVCSWLLRRTDGWRTRLTACAILLAVAIAIGGLPYLERARSFGDPFIGNWDDQLGHPYRQGPGFRTTGYFTTLGAALTSHPFRSRAASLWDSLYVSAVTDGFGRFIQAPYQHHLTVLLVWLALPLTLTCLWGLIAQTDGATPLESLAVWSAVLGLAAIARFNLELPYWSTAKAVFLLGLTLPVAAAFERGYRGIAARGALPARLLDVSLGAFVVTSIACFVYR